MGSDIKAGLHVRGDEAVSGVEHMLVSIKFGEAADRAEHTVLDEAADTVEHMLISIKLGEVASRASRVEHLLVPTVLGEAAGWVEHMVAPTKLGEPAGMVKYLLVPTALGEAADWAEQMLVPTNLVEATGGVEQMLLANELGGWVSSVFVVRKTLLEAEAVLLRLLAGTAPSRVEVDMTVGLWLLSANTVATEDTPEVVAETGGLWSADAVTPTELILLGVIPFALDKLLPQISVASEIIKLLGLVANNSVACAMWAIVIVGLWLL